MTRQELRDTQQHLRGEAFIQLKKLLGSEPEVSGISPDHDLFLVTFSTDIISDISYALESVTWDMAERYAQKVERGTNSAEEDEAHQYWQSLHEKWGYLEMAAD